MSIDEPMEFIFDQQMHMDGIVRDHWHLMLDNPEVPEGAVIGLPSFRNDKVFLPLQAADLNAWWTRRRWLAGKEKAEWQYPWPRKREFPGLEISFTKELIREMFWSWQSISGRATATL